MEERTGCDACWSKDDAQAAFSAWYDLPIVHVVARESHFSVVLRRCQACGQHQASATCEVVIMGPSGDRRESLHVPLSVAEAEALMGAGAAGAEGMLNALAPRRHIVHVEGGRGPCFTTGAIAVAAYD